MMALRKDERWLSTVVLIAAPLVGVIGGLLSEDFGGGMSQELAYISANPTRWLISNYCTLLMGTLMTMAIFILIGLVRDRAAVLGYVGGALAIVGIYFHGPVVGYSLVEAPLVRSALPQEQVLTFVEQGMYAHVAFTIILIPFLGFFLGMILLAVALWRADRIPVWVAAIIVAAPLTEFFGPQAVSPELMFLLFAIGLGYVGLKTLRGTDRNFVS
jgi:hypothetical protein